MRARRASSPPSTPERRPSQHTASSSSSLRPRAQRGCRPTVMSESNCAAPAEKPSRSSPSISERPSDTSSGPACTRSPGGSSGSASRCARRTAPSTCTQRALGPHGAAIGSWATASPSIRTSPSGRQGSRTKKPGDDRLRVPVGGAPVIQTARLGEVQDPHGRFGAWVTNEVDGGLLPVAQARSGQARTTRCLRLRLHPDRRGQPAAEHVLVVAEAHRERAAERLAVDAPRARRRAARRARRGSAASPGSESETRTKRPRSPGLERRRGARRRPRRCAGRRRGSGRRAGRASGCRAWPRCAPRGPRRCTCSSASASSCTRSHGTPRCSAR